MDRRHTDNCMIRGRQFAQELCIAVKKWCSGYAHDSLTSKSTALGMLAIGAIVSVILAVGFSVVPSGLRSAAGDSLEIDNYTRVATEHDSNACASQPCRHKGVCTASDVNDSYLCACEKGFHGDSCENKFWDRVMNDGKEDDDADWWDAAAASVDDIDETMCVSCAPYAFRSCTQHCVLRWWCSGWSVPTHIVLTTSRSHRCLDYHRVCTAGPCLNGGECVTDLDFGPHGDNAQLQDGTVRGHCRCMAGYDGPACEVRAPYSRHMVNFVRRCCTITDQRWWSVRSMRSSISTSATRVLAGTGCALTSRADSPVCATIFGTTTYFCSLGCVALQHGCLARAAIRS